MNCDQAFELITSPTQHDNLELQQHLQTCRRCCDLVEIFEPALHLLQSEPSPVLWSAEEADIDLLDPEPNARSASRARSESPEYWRSVETQQRRQGLHDGMKVAALMLLVAVFAVGLAIIGRTDAAPFQQVAALSTEDCLRRQTEGKEIAPLMAACFACHLDESEQSKLSPDSQTRASRLLQRCVACHFDLKPKSHEIAESVGTNNTDEIAANLAHPCLRLSL